MQQQNPPRIVIYPQPVYRRQPVQCGGECCTKCALIFFTIVCFLVGFILTMVGNLAKPFWGPEDDWCAFCREDRLQTERQLRNCRIAGPIFLGIGGLLLIASILYCRAKRNDNAGQVITGPTTRDQMGSTTHGGTGTVTAPPQYPPGSQGYGQTHHGYGAGTGPYPHNPPPPPAGYSPCPTGPAYPSPTQYSYTSPQTGQGYQAYPTEMTPPSYESTIGQSTVSPSAPPLEKDMGS